EFAVAARRLAERAAAQSDRRTATTRTTSEAGIELPPLQCYARDDSLTYEHLRAGLDRRAGTATPTVPRPAPPQSLAATDAGGAAAWSLATARELDDAISGLRSAEPELGTWLLKPAGDAAAVVATDEMLLAGAAAGDWLASEIIALWRRTLRRLDATSRSLV